MSDFHNSSATELLALFNARAATPYEVTSALLTRIAEREPSLGAWQFLDADLALANAGNIKQGAGPLWGIAVGVKDLFDTKDMPTTYGSKAYAEHRPAQDASCVELLRRAGAIIMGKTVTTEFAAVFEPGKTVNPYDPSRSPGGSSSGSAAAVADRMIPIAIGTQTAGSIIRPAAYCGVFGFKPTFGAVSTRGVKSVSPSLDTVGFFARSAEDLLLLASVLATQDQSTPAPTLPHKAAALSTLDTNPAPRIAYCRTKRWCKARPAVQEAVDATARLLSDQNAIVEQIELGQAFEELVEASDIIFHFEVAREFQHEYHSCRPLLSSGLISTIEAGLQVDSASYNSAIRLAKKARRSVATTFDSYDAILTPAIIDEAPLLETTGDPLFCRSWTLLGYPTVTIPGMHGPSGLPIGVQFVGHAHGDTKLLEITRWIATRMPEQPAPDATRRVLAHSQPVATLSSQ